MTSAAIEPITATPEATLPADLTWENIVEQHSARVYRLAYHLTGNKHDAEDLTQDVFIRVFNSLSQYKPGTFEGWLHRITTNLFLDRVRRKKRIRFDFMADDDAAVPTSDSFDRYERSGQPEDAFDMSHFGDDIVQALAELPPEYRAAVVLSDIEGLSYEEIAATLGIKMGTVRSRLSRARAKLRESLAHRAPVRSGV
jgi:RNA polymerase sigma factor (sigma-70 family)